MSLDAVIAALHLPAAARVDQRVPKKLLTENGAPTAADKRRITEGIDALHWLAALKPTTCGVPEFRDEAREYLEIAVLRVTLRDKAKEARLIELVHRAVPYPVLLLVERGEACSVSLAHKRHALNEAGKVVLESDPISVAVDASDGAIHSAFLAALDLLRQPRATLYALYQGWQDKALALQAARLTGAFTVLDSAERARQRREALHSAAQLEAHIAELRRAAAKASQISRQVELNLQIQRLQAELAAAHAQL